MSMTLMVQAMKLKVGNPTRKLVLIKLADNANDAGECWPSYRNIADHCEVSRRSVMSHIKKLEDEGYLTREHRKGEKGNSSNIYHLNLSGGEKSSSRGENNSLGSENISPSPSENISPRTSHSLEPVSEPNPQPPKGGDRIDYEKVKELWNHYASQNPDTAKKVRVVSQKTKRQLPQLRKRYKSVCKELGREPKPFDQWLNNYIQAAIADASTWVGKNGDHAEWKANLEWVSRVKTYDNLLNKQEQ